MNLWYLLSTFSTCSTLLHADCVIQSVIRERDREKRRREEKEMEEEEEEEEAEKQEEEDKEKEIAEKEMCI